MSADNWTTCPKCERAVEADRERATKKAAAAYGKVPATDYLDLRALAEEERPLPETLREDYEIGIAGGHFEVNYRASCTACDFAYEFKHSEKATS